MLVSWTAGGSSALDWMLVTWTVFILTVKRGRLHVIEAREGDATLQRSPKRTLFLFISVH
jgi:hypothetical protein